MFATTQVWWLLLLRRVLDLKFGCFFFFHFPLAYSIQGQNVQMISPSSESHQQVVAVGQPLALQPQGTVMVSTTCDTCLAYYLLSASLCLKSGNR